MKQQDTKKHLSLTFTILGIPQPKQSARFRAVKFGNKTIVQSYQKKEVKQNERNIQFDIKSQLPKDFKPFDCAIEVDVTFVFPPLSMWSKKKRTELESGNKVYKTTKPDLTDNLMKGLFDAMQGIVYVDDSRICKVRSEKIYGLVPKIELIVKQV